MFDIEKAKAEIIARHYAEFPKEPTGPTGPKTEAGKQRTRLNAYKHGLTGQIHLLTPEEHEAFEKHCQSTVQALATVGNIEQQLAQSIAEDYWRLNRARALETGIFSLGLWEDDLVEPEQFQVEALPIDRPQINSARSQARTWLADSKNLQLLSLYTQRIQRSIEKSMAELRTLRGERVAARQQAVEEAILLAELAKSKSEAYHVAADFRSQEFVFSSAEIESSLPKWIVRKQRLDEARALPKPRINPNPSRQMAAAA